MAAGEVFPRPRRLEKLMRLARAPDPEAAFEEQKARVRNEVKCRGKRSLVGSNAASEVEGIVARALALVAKMTIDERHEFMAELMEQYPARDRVECCDCQQAVSVLVN
jgi:hypothetical protein